MKRKCIYIVQEAIFPAVEKLAVMFKYSLNT